MNYSYNLGRPHLRKFFQLNIRVYTDSTMDSTSYMYPKAHLVRMRVDRNIKSGLTGPQNQKYFYSIMC